ncbi:Hypp4573 [Branchiostoma lanceolatum]|uniref:Hypp4573 protein n=2 Tax=Branchiostoma lanceolatum TaxID=7740 RepID=A0A8K0A977_BRALA|nr:Hypp4573 [Branchiostoma lanceolatum]
MTGHFALVLALTLLAGAVYPAKTMSTQDQQLNDEDIKKAEVLLKEIEDLVQEEVNPENNNVGDDDMALRQYGALRPNIANGRPTFQSSVAHGGSPGRAVDGNRRPIWGSSSCTHTNAENDPWWYVDLGMAVTVDHIAIVNRRDCCHGRITPFDVHVGFKTAVAGNPRCGGHHRFPATNNEHVVNCRGRRGRYVGIRLPGKSRILTLCEVEVYAAPNLALGKPTVQSAVAHNGYASRATDGCRARAWPSKCCTHTPAMSNPWLQVDLGRTTSVQWVSLFNRRDCCSGRLNPFTIHIGNNANINQNPRCGGHHTIPTNLDTDAINCNGLRGRYVGIRLPGNGRILTVCELEVYAGTVTKKRTAEVRGIEGQDCGEHKDGESWVSGEENCLCDLGEEGCTKVDCGQDGDQQPIKDEDGMWSCPPEPDEDEQSDSQEMEEGGTDPQELEEGGPDGDPERRMLAEILGALEQNDVRTAEDELEPNPNE